MFTLCYETRKKGNGRKQEILFSVQVSSRLNWISLFGILASSYTLLAKKNLQCTRVADTDNKCSNTNRCQFVGDIVHVMDSV